MAMPDPGHPPSRPQEQESGAELALLPLAATAGYYLLPDSFQSFAVLQFVPQMLAFLCLAWWAACNKSILSKLGCEPAKIPQGLKLGLLTGLLLGPLNTWMILGLFPALGYDISFLTETPHAKIPTFIMVPWFIGVIAGLVEVNFRGFLLGRLARLEARMWELPLLPWFFPLSLIVSALVFAFDPFMTATFRQLHWIAVWDGLVWGMIWLRFRNLFATIVAHAIEVMVMYSAVRAALAP